MTDACLAVFEGAELDKAADRFLNHRDQKFRLSYVLGGWQKSDAGDEEEELSFDDDEEDEVPEDGAVPETERVKNRQTLERYLARITNLANTVVAQLSRDLEVDVSKVSGPDREAAQQLIEENFEAHLNHEEEFQEVVQDILMTYGHASIWWKREIFSFDALVGPSSGYSAPATATTSSDTFAGSPAITGHSSGAC